MKIDRFLDIFGREHSDLGYSGRLIPAAHTGIQENILLNTLVSLGIRVPVEEGSKLPTEQDWGHRELANAEDALWVLRDGTLTPYELTSMEQMRRHLNAGTVFVVRPSPRKDASPAQRETPEPLRFLFSARHGNSWALLDQDSRGLAAMAQSLTDDPLEDLDNSGGLFRALADIIIAILNWFTLDDPLRSTYSSDRANARLLEGLRELGQQLDGKVFEVSYNQSLIITDPPKPAPNPEPEKIPDRLKNTVPEREIEVPLEGGVLLDEGYMNGTKPFPGMEDVHELGQSLGEFKPGEAEPLLNRIAGNGGYRQDLRGVITLIGGSGNTYATASEIEKYGISADSLRNKIIDIILDPPEHLRSLDDVQQTMRNKSLPKLERRAAYIIDYLANVPNKDKTSHEPGGIKLLRDMQAGEDSLDLAPINAKRSIHALLAKQTEEPRLSERNIRLTQLAWQICHWAYAQNCPLNMSMDEQIHLRGSVILADVTRKGLAAQQQLQNGQISDALLTDYYTMKVLEQPILATYQENQGDISRAQPMAEVLVALGSKQTRKALLDGVRRSIEEKLANPEERQQLEALVNGTDKERDALCQQMYSGSLGHAREEAPKARKGRRVNFGGTRLVGGNKLSEPEKKLVVSTTIIENVSREMLQTWTEDLTTGSKDPETGEVDPNRKGSPEEMAQLRKWTQKANQLHDAREEAFLAGKYKNYDEYPAEMRSSALPGKPTEESKKENPDPPKSVILP